MKGIIMCKILFFCIFFVFTFSKGQTFGLKDSISFLQPNSYTFFKADIFNSLYYLSKDQNSLLKYNGENKRNYKLENLTSSKKIFIVNPLFIVVWDGSNKKIEFYDDKLISTQDNLLILNNEIIDSRLVYIEDNKRLTYFDEYVTRKFVQYDYRKKNKIFYSNSIDNKLLAGYKPQDVYTFKHSKFLLLSLDSNSKNKQTYKILKINTNGEILSYDIALLDYYFWNEDKFVIIADENVIIYDFENEPISIKLPKKGDAYFILNDQLFLQQANTVYIYQLKN